jgi:hypothetical protein
MNNLPNEVLEWIMHNTDSHTVASMARVNKNFKDVAKRPLARLKRERQHLISTLRNRLLTSIEMSFEIPGLMSHATMANIMPDVLRGLWVTVSIRNSTDRTFIDMWEGYVKLPLTIGELYHSYQIKDRAGVKLLTIYYKDGNTHIGDRGWFRETAPR